MAELKRALQDFKEMALADDLASKRIGVAVVTLDCDVKELQDFVRVSDWRPMTLTAQGPAHVGSAIDKALAMIASRKQKYRNCGLLYYLPRIIMITRGEFELESTDTIRDTVAKIREMETDQRIAFHPLMVTDADIELLCEVSVRLPLRLAGLDFRELFRSGFYPARTRCDEPGEPAVLPPLNWIKV